MIYLEIIIATAFILFLLSSLVSGINELWAMLLNKRGRELRRALNQAFPELDDQMMRALYNHPLIAPLKEKPKKDSMRGGALKVVNFFRFKKFNQDFLPSYLDSKLFSRALADILVLGKEYNDPSTSYGDEIRQLYTTVESLDLKNYELFETMYLKTHLTDDRARKIWNKLKLSKPGDFEKTKRKILLKLKEEMASKTKLDPKQQGEALLSRFLVHSGTEQPSTTDFLARHSHNLESWLENTSKWFDGYMNRVSGWYKKRSHTNIFWWSLLFVMLFNINLFSIVSSLYKDHSLRDAWVQRAEAFQQNPDAKSEIDTSAEELKHWLKPQSVNDVLEWFSEPSAWSQDDLERFIAWIVTALAIALGAPFWYDILSKSISLRAAGKKTDQDANSKT